MYALNVLKVYLCDLNFLNENAETSEKTTCVTISAESLESLHDLLSAA